LASGSTDSAIRPPRLSLRGRWHVEKAQLRKGLQKQPAHVVSFPKDDKKRKTHSAIPSMQWPERGREETTATN